MLLISAWFAKHSLADNVLTAYSAASQPAQLPTSNLPPFSTSPSSSAFTLSASLYANRKFNKSFLHYKTHPTRKEQALLHEKRCVRSLSAQQAAATFPHTSPMNKYCSKRFCADLERLENLMVVSQVK